MHCVGILVHDSHRRYHRGGAAVEWAWQALPLDKDCRAPREVLRVEDDMARIVGFHETVTSAASREPRHWHAEGNVNE